MKQLLATFLAAAFTCAAPAETLGTRLDRMNELKGRAELARQERTLQEELLRAGAAALPTVVSISGRSENLVARLQVSATSQRNFTLGDSVGGGFTIVSILPQEVLVGRAAGKGGDLSTLPLAFAQPEVAGKSGSAPPNLPPVPALPAAMPVLQPPAQR